MNIEQERATFESNHNSIGLAFGTEINFSKQVEAYLFVDSFDTHDTEMVESLVTVNDRWFGWLSCAKVKQAEIDALKAEIEALKPISRRHENGLEDVQQD